MHMSPWNATSHSVSYSTQWNPLQWDAITQYYPWRVFYARSMRQGYIPLWNPHQFCGTPFLANGQSAVLYPPNLLFLVFDPITAFTLLALLHLFLAAAFMYLLLRELGTGEFGGIVGGITFAFGAFTVLWLELPTFVAAAVWLPLVLLLIHRAVERGSLLYGMLSGLALSMAFLAGHLQVAFYVALAAALWWLWKFVAVWREEGKTDAVLRVVAPAAACLVIVGLISGAQVLPSQELAANSHRVREVTQDGYNRFISNAAPPYRLITAFAPDFYGNPSKDNYYLIGAVGDHIGSAADYMEYGMYAGVLPLLLAIFGIMRMRKARHVGFFVLLAAIALLSATGTPINRLFYYGVPGFSALGGPNRILLLYLFGVAVLAGFGADFAVGNNAQCDSRLRIRRIAAAACGLFLFAVVALSAALPVARSAMARTLLDEYIWIRPALIGSMLLLVSPALFLIKLRHRDDARLFKAIVLLMILADLFAFGINYNPTCDRSQVYPETELIAKLKRLAAGGERIAPINPEWNLWETPKAILPPNAAMVYGLYDVQGYDSLYTKAYKDLSSRIQGMDSSPPENGNMVLVRRYTPEFASMTRFVLTKGELTDPCARLVGKADDVRIYEMKGSRASHRLSPRFVPFTFRFGLFLMLLGVGALSAVGVFTRICCNTRRKR